MADDASDGGTDSWVGGGVAALERLTPEVATSFSLLVSVRPAGVHDEVLDDRAVVAFAEQFRVDVSVIDAQLRENFVRSTGGHQFVVVQMVWIGDVAPRVRAALDALFGPSEWVRPRRHPVAEPWAAVDGFMKSVARLDALDPTATELIRLRGARLHDCRLCSSRRSAAAIEHGANEDTFEAIDSYETSGLPEATKAALALVDAMIWTPLAIPTAVVDDVRRLLSPEQAVEVVLDVARNAANKIAVALRADDPEITDGVQLFLTDLDGELTTL